MITNQSYLKCSIKTSINLGAHRVLRTLFDVDTFLNVAEWAAHRNIWNGES